jgi:hypothetical protein
MVLSAHLVAQQSPRPVEPRATGSDGLGALAFMAGCWAGDFGAGTIEEQYTAANAGLMLGTTRYLRDGRVIDFEFSKVDGRGSVVTLFPHPKGVASDSFPVREISARRVVFENLAHDFPQRIIYQRTDDGGLIARIEGATATGGIRYREWRMRRVSCPGA